MALAIPAPRPSPPLKIRRSGDNRTGPGDSPTRSRVGPSTASEQWEIHHAQEAGVRQTGLRRTSPVPRSRPQMPRRSGHSSALQPCSGSCRRSAPRTASQRPRTLRPGARCTRRWSRSARTWCPSPTPTATPTPLDILSMPLATLACWRGAADPVVPVHRVMNTGSAVLRRGSTHSAQPPRRQAAITVPSRIGPRYRPSVTSLSPGRHDADAKVKRIVCNRWRDKMNGQISRRVLGATLAMAAAIAAMSRPLTMATRQSPLSNWAWMA